MHKRLLFTASINTLLLTAGSLTRAQEISRQERDTVESIGIITGMTLGAIAGGPPGAVVSAAVGGWVSDKILAGRENKLLKRHMAANLEELQGLQEEHTELQLDLARVQRQLDQRQLVASTGSSAPASTCCTENQLILHFRSNSAQVEPLYEDALQNFINNVRNVPNAVIEISGHTDRRGPNAENLSLSQRRVSAVETRLRALGLRNVTYQTVANGEQVPVSRLDSVETNFFDRRVELRLAESGTTRVSMK